MGRLKQKKERMKVMENKEVVLKVLNECGCVSSKFIASAAKRKFNYDITPAAVGGVLRGMIARGEAGRSNCGAGTVYWLVR